MSFQIIGGTEARDAARGSGERNVSAPRNIVLRVDLPVLEFSRMPENSEEQQDSWLGRE